MGTNDRDRRGYDTGAAEETQGNIQGIVTRLESLLNTREQHVRTAMANFRADGVDEDYEQVADRWKKAADEVRGIIRLLDTVLEDNTQTAHSTIQRAKGSVGNIG